MTERLTKRIKFLDGSETIDVANGRTEFLTDHEALVRALFKKLAHYEDLEEQGRLVELPAENDFKRDELDRCRHRNCNKCDGYRKEIQRHKDLEKQGRLVVLPEKLDPKRLLNIIADLVCPRYVGLEDWGHDKEKCPSAGCKECWEKALKGE